MLREITTFALIGTLAGCASGPEHRHPQLTRSDGYLDDLESDSDSEASKNRAGAMGGVDCRTTAEPDDWQEEPSLNLTSAATRKAVTKEPEDASFGGGRSSEVVTPPGFLIDKALGTFRAQRASTRRFARRARVHGDQWIEVLSAIDDACMIKPGDNDMGSYVRARVTLEVELEMDKQKKRWLPKDLGKRIDRTLGCVDGRVAELRLSSPDGRLRPPSSNRSSPYELYFPVSNAALTSPFGVRKDPMHGRRRFHEGIDLGARSGTPVRAAEDGQVVYAGRYGGFGKHVVIAHGDGLRTHYSHLQKILVKPGAQLKRGDAVGTVGSTGRSTGPHLHFAVTTRDGRYHDPIPLFYRPFQIGGNGQVATVR